MIRHLDVIRIRQAGTDGLPDSDPIQINRSLMADADSGSGNVANLGGRGIAVIFVPG